MNESKRVLVIHPDPFAFWYHSRNSRWILTAVSSLLWLLWNLVLLGLLEHYSQAAITQSSSPMTGIIASVCPFAAFALAFAILGKFCLEIKQTKVVSAKLGGIDANGGTEPDSPFLCDISSSKTQNQLLGRLSEMIQRERLIADYAQDALICLDTELTVVSANHTALQLCGSAELLLNGCSVSQLILPTEWNDFRAKLLESRQERKPCSLTCQVGGTDRETKDTDWWIEYSVTEDSYFCIVKDITTRRQMERFKEQLFSMLGHDLRVPLTSVLFAIAGMKEDSNLSARSKELAEMAEQSVKRVVNLSNDMLDFQKSENGQLSFSAELIDVSDVLEDIVFEFGPAFEAVKQNCVTEIDESFTISADKQRLKQVLANLVSNANKYAGESATVRIGSKTLGEFVEIVIEDSGPGIPDELKNVVFEPYKQLASRPLSGYGLGLALSKELVTALGGTMGLRDSDLGGCSFWLRFKVAESSERTHS